MELRKIGIYNQLFKKLSTKQELADFFSVSTKTIENTIKECEDIVYSKKLGSYHFKDLLPNHISYQNYFTLFKDSVTSSIIKKDFSTISSSLHSKFDETMIATSQLSELSRKIIKTEIAINHNCILKVEYTGNSKSKEEKYIQPKRIFTGGSIYYLSVIYDKRNKEKVGEERQFAFNGIESIEIVEYLKDTIFRSEQDGNAFGSYNNVQTIRLKLHGASANFFKREGLFETNSFRFLSELTTNEIEIEMTYNYKLEVVKLVQQWLPQITIVDDSEKAQKIIEEIKNNYKTFTDSL